MALYSPTSLSPSLISVNANNDITISWTYNGSDLQDSYRIKIYLNSTNTLVYDTDVTSSSNNFHVVSSGILVNNNIYKYTVTTWSGASSATSSWTIFYCNSPATLSLGALPTSSQQYAFSATYSQIENVPLKTYEALLFLASDLTTPIDESGIIYPDVLVENGDTIEWLFDGLISETSYAIQFKGITQQNEEIETAITTFYIEYEYPNSIPALVVTPDDTNGTISLDWVALKQKLGTVEGTYSYVEGKFGKGLQLDSGSILSYVASTPSDQGYDIPEDYTLYFWVKIPLGYNGTLVKFGTDDTGMQVFITENNRFGFKCGDYITVGRQIETLFPSDALYPSETLYPTGGEVLENFVLIGVKHATIIIKSQYFEEILSM